MREVKYILRSKSYQVTTNLPHSCILLGVDSVWYVFVCVCVSVNY